jgi:predicted DNA-binding protein YlxM (UPF0122 family)
MKLNNDQIKKIAIEYATGNGYITMGYLSDSYKVSKSTISSAIHRAISECFVDTETALKIAKKAVEHDRLRQEQLGYPPNEKVRIFYENLIHSMEEKLIRTFSDSELASLFQEKELLRFQISSYDQTMSSSDEAPDLNYLRRKLHEVRKKIWESTRI